MSKVKRQNKNKGEITQDLEKIAETKRMRARVKTELYPLLKEASKSIDNAKVFCQAGALAIEQAFSNLQKSMRVKDLNILDHINPEGEQSEYFLKLMKMFEEETITNALSMVRDMPYAIDTFIREEMTKRPLSSLKEDLLD